MLVVDVLAVGVLVLARLVGVRMRVRPAGGEALVMVVVVVPVVAAMRVVVGQGRMFVRVIVLFRQVEVHAHRREQPAGPRRPTTEGLAEGEGDDRPEERRDREHRPGARRAENTLGAKVEAQAAAERPKGKEHSEFP
jgi:hypothetical protein